MGHTKASDHTLYRQGRGQYKAVLPHAIQLHYDEEDDNLLNLRSKAALLDAFLKDALSKIDDKGSAINSKLMRENMYQLMAHVSTEQGKVYLRIS